MPEHRSVIAWEAPPETGFGRNKVDWSQALHQLRTNPGHWARIAEYDREATAASAAQSLRKRHPEYEFRSTIVREGGVGREYEGTSRVYGRFVGVMHDHAVDLAKAA